MCIRKPESETQCPTKTLDASSVISFVFIEAKYLMAKSYHGQNNVNNTYNPNALDEMFSMTVQCSVVFLFNS